MDLTGGLSETREHFFSSCPEQPGMRESVSMWISDDRGDIALPRIAIEAVSPSWDAHLVQVNIAFPDGRVVAGWQQGPAATVEDEQGRPTRLGAGPLVFEVVEPFRHLRATFSGSVVDTHVDAQLARSRAERSQVEVEFTIDATMAVPPWISGALLPEARERLDAKVEGGFMGGDRYEQLFRAAGSVQVGSTETTFSGSGLRIHRQGVRDVTGFWGHCWQSALFPSGRAFGLNLYPPRPDGSPSYNEGYLFLGEGELIPARVVEAPWMTELAPRGQDVSFVLETEDGRTRIEAETVLSTFMLGTVDPPDFPPLQQATARYRWDGEETYGMIERSYPGAVLAGASTP